MNPDYEDIYQYTKKDIESIADKVYSKYNDDKWDKNNKSSAYDKSNVKSSMTASSLEQRRRQKIEERRAYIKAALMMLKKYKGCNIQMQDLETQEGWGPMDPLARVMNYIVHFIDEDKYFQLQYSGYGMNNPGLYCKFIMLINESDFDPHYGPQDYEAHIKQGAFPPDTLICVRLAVKIYKAWKEHIK